MRFCETAKLITICYPGGSGGKFVSSCLTLSPNVFPMLPAKRRRWVYHELILGRINDCDCSADAKRRILKLLSEVHFEKQQDGNAETEKWRFLVLEFIKECGNLETRMEWIKYTLPISSEEFPVWKDYELRQFHQLFRRNYLQRTYFHPDYYEQGFFGALMESRMHFFMTFHKESQFRKFLTLYPNSKQVRFINTSKWIELALSKGKKHFPRDPEMYEVPRGVDFDVETFFSEQRFLDEIWKLYDFFDFPGYDRPAISEFYRLYMSLHGFRSLVSA